MQPDRKYLISLFLLFISCQRTQEFSLKVYFIDVGHGDCILIQTPDDQIPNNGIYEGRNILIDGGDEVKGREIVLPFLLRLKIDTIDILLATHFHSDHIGGLIPVLEGFPARSILTYAKEKRGGLNTRFLESVSAENSLHRIVKAGDTICLGREIKAYILNPITIDEDENNNSIVLKIEYQGKGLLFSGDIEGKDRRSSAEEIKYAEKKMVDNYREVLRAFVLKVPHHGSETSSTLEFLKAVSPKIAVITAGRKKFGNTLLPDSSVVLRLRGIGAEIYRTDFGDTDYLTAAGDDHILVKISPDGKVTAKYLHLPVF